MDNTFNLSLIKQTCTDIFDNEAVDIGEVDGNFCDIQLSNEDIELLADKIRILPNDHQEALIARICFDLSPRETSKIFGITNPKKIVNTARIILGYSLSLKTGERISLNSLSRACDLVLSSFVTDIEEIAEEKSQMEYINKVKHLFGYHNKKKSYTSLASVFLKQVAVFVLSILVCGITVLTVNASIREKFFDWVITVYEKYSSYGIDSPSSKAIENLDIISQHVVFGYMPENFELEDEYVSDKRINIQYSDKSGTQIILMITTPDASQNLNTEDIVVEEGLINNHLSHIWVKDEVTYIVWENQGCLLSLITELKRETAIKIAENVVFYDNLSK